jgi:hypothetical protein
VGVDIDLDALRALFAVTQATDRGGFAPALDAVSAADAHQHQGLGLHRRHGKFVGPDGWHVGQDSFDCFNHDSQV